MCNCDVALVPFEGPGGDIWIHPRSIVAVAQRDGATVVLTTAGYLAVHGSVGDCGVSHDDPCLWCGAAAFHKPGCSHYARPRR